MHSSIQKWKPQWLHCSFRCLNTCQSTCGSAKGYRKFHRAMCSPTWSWSFMHATRCCSTCHITSIISWVWWSHFVLIAHTLTCFYVFSNSRWVVLVIHRASSCWAPLHATLLIATTARWSLWRFQATTCLSSLFACLRGALRPHLWFFQLEVKWNQALKTQ